MRRDVQEIFKMTPRDKQVMMFSATLNKEIRLVCKKFMQDVISHGLLYYFFKSKPSSMMPTANYLLLKSNRVGKQILHHFLLDF